MSEEYLIKGRDRIAKAVGCSCKQFASLVDEEGLPAFQKTENGPWFARPDDLDIWSIWKADKYLPEEWGEIRSRYQHLIYPSNEGKAIA